MKRIVSVWAYLMRQQVRSIDMGDVQVIVGLSALTYGVSQVSVAAAWMTFGVLLLAGWVAPRIPRAPTKE